MNRQTQLKTKTSMVEEMIIIIIITRYPYAAMLYRIHQAAAKSTWRSRAQHADGVLPGLLSDESDAQVKYATQSKVERKTSRDLR